MPAHALLIEVRLPGGRYHGVGDWPPAPFRLFQALVAGAYGGRWRSEPDKEKDAVFHETLETMLPLSHFLSLHCPATPATTGMINASTIDLLPEIILGPIGLADDLLVVGAALNRLLGDVHPDVVRSHWSGQGDALDAIHRVTAWSGDLVRGRFRAALRRLFP